MDHWMRSCILITCTIPFQIQKVRVDSMDQWAVTLKSLMNARRRRENLVGLAQVKGVWWGHGSLVGPAQVRHESVGRPRVGGWSREGMLATRCSEIDANDVR